MALPSSLPLALSQIKTEFGGGGTLAAYYRGGGYVANHTANASIPTSGTIAISNFLGAEKNFTCSMTQGTDGYSVYGYAAGYAGSISRSGIGTSPSSTNQVTFDGFYDSYADIGFGPFYVATIFAVSGNTTGTWWTTATWGSVSLSRSSSAAPSGTYDGSGQTYWNWSTGPYFSSSGTNTFTLTI